nr:unnamed protein product [Callosobruchus chinensis]
MELESYDNSFDFSIEEEDFYESPPLKKHTQKRVTFSKHIFSKTRVGNGNGKNLSQGEDSAPSISMLKSALPSSVVSALHQVMLKVQSAQKKP